MDGVAGLGRSVLPNGGAGLPPWAGELAGSLDQLGVQLNADNVLAVQRVLLAEAQRLERAGKMFGSEAVVRECGGDPVSRDAAREFTPRLQALVREGMLVADMLRAAGGRLGESARAYGRAEAEITASLRGIGERR